MLDFLAGASRVRATGAKPNLIYSTTILAMSIEFMMKGPVYFWYGTRSRLDLLRENMATSSSLYMENALPLAVVGSYY